MDQRLNPEWPSRYSSNLQGTVGNSYGAGKARRADEITQQIAQRGTSLGLWLLLCGGVLAAEKGYHSVVEAQRAFRDQIIN